MGKKNTNAENLQFRMIKQWIVGCLKDLCGKLDILISASAVCLAVLLRYVAYYAFSKLDSVCESYLPSLTVDIHESRYAHNKYCKRKISSVWYIL